MAVFGSSQTEPDSPQWVEAERVGALLAEAGLGVVTGGYGGTMEAASRGAVGSGGTAIGVTAPALFLKRSGANNYVTEEIETASLAERLGVLVDLASGAIVLPGSIGTVAELVVAWNLNHIARRNGGRRLPTVAVGDGWSSLWRLLTDELGAFEGDIHRVETVDEAVDWLLGQPEISLIVSTAT